MENTERSNGIVQDEPEIIVQCTEKVDVLFNRIKLSTREAAQIYGNILCQLTHDLVPPKEVLTKVIKELLTLSQPHCEVIARILFQVTVLTAYNNHFPLVMSHFRNCPFLFVSNAKSINFCFRFSGRLSIHPTYLYYKIGWYVRCQIFYRFRLVKQFGVSPSSLYRLQLIYIWSNCCQKF